MNTLDSTGAAHVDDARTRIAIAVVRRGDQVLIGQRGAGQALAGYWEFPGGKQAAGESSAAAAVRECREEAGLAVTVTGVLDVVEHDYEHGRLRLSFQSCIPNNGDDCDDVGEPFRWVPIERLSEYEFPPANASVLKILRTTCDAK